MRQLHTHNTLRGAVLAEGGVQQLQGPPQTEQVHHALDQDARAGGVKGGRVDGGGRRGSDEEAAQLEPVLREGAVEDGDGEGGLVEQEGARLEVMGVGGVGEVVAEVPPSIVEAEVELREGSPLQQEESVVFPLSSHRLEGGGLPAGSDVAGEEGALECEVEGGVRGGVIVEEGDLVRVEVANHRSTAGDAGEGGVPDGDGGALQRELHETGVEGEGVAEVDSLQEKGLGGGETEHG